MRNTNDDDGDDTELQWFLMSSAGFYSIMWYKRNFWWRKSGFKCLRDIKEMHQNQGWALLAQIDASSWQLGLKVSFSPNTNVNISNSREYFFPLTSPKFRPWVCTFPGQQTSDLGFMCAAPLVTWISFHEFPISGSLGLEEPSQPSLGPSRACPPQAWGLQTPPGSPSNRCPPFHAEIPAGAQPGELGAVSSCPGSLVALTNQGVWKPPGAPGASTRGCGIPGRVSQQHP